jgi:hypothetical protein
LLQEENLVATKKKLWLALSIYRTSLRTVKINFPPDQASADASSTQH